MTAEIIVMNPIGIALAADSAMTMTAVNSGTVKIFNNAEKIYDISKVHPVGMMIFNNADFCGTPWELSIRTYRKQFGHEEKDYIYEYVHSFINFIASDRDIAPLEKKHNKLNGIFRNYLTNHYKNLSESTLHNELPEDDNAALNLIHSRLEVFYRNENEALENNAFFEGFNSDDLALAIEYTTHNYADIAREIIPFDGEYPVGLAKELIKFFANIICKVNVSTLFSGMVFAGFGRKEFYPSVLAFKVYGWFNGKVIYSVDHAKCSTSSPDNSTIIPFASEDEVFTFVQGCNNSILNFINEASQQLTDIINDHIENLQIQDNELKSKVSELPIMLMSRLNSYINSNFTQKVTTMLNSLSKKDLAYMAESLVNLSAFKLKISDAYETVGGPIDVAVISKTDGFVWIKRKLYFSKELNNN